MTSTAGEVLSEGRRGRVTTVFCADVPLARQQITAAAEDLKSIPTLVALEWMEAPPLTKESQEIRNALADAALTLWPHWYSTTLQRFSHAARVKKRGRESHADAPGASRSWYKEVSELCQNGKRPLASQMVISEQVRQLALALDPTRLLFVLSVESAQATPARIRGLAKAAAWLAHESQCKTLLLLPSGLADQGELDHVNYESCTLDQGESEDVPRSGTSPPPAETSKNLTDAGSPPQVLVGPIVGRPHPASEVELLIHKLIKADQELSPLFEFNQPLAVPNERHFIVDLVWHDGGLVIELDGPEHRRHMTYVRDRDRDYQLLLTGYTTLRITNDEVYVNETLVLDKIRNVVAVRRKQQKYNS